ncbi:MAG TPA: hypothetical protein VMD25_02910 [Acidobacteriaceae bacterium]|nr:hypothetical protein [Acidobacteriaceae bacterium]
MRIPLLGVTVDERFLAHRWRSTSFGGMAGALVALSLFEYRWIRYRVWDWGMFSVLLAMAVVKLAFMAWYHFTD